MRLRLASMMVVAAALGACGQPEGVVQFLGLTPNTSLQKDTRKLATVCPRCSKPVDPGAARCPNKKSCGIEIHWREKYACGYCGGTKACSACVLMGQDKGKCYNCKGTGSLVYAGSMAACPNCKGKDGGACPICKGKTTCDFCGGEGFITLDSIKAKAPAGATPEEPMEEPKEEPKAEPKEEPKPEEPQEEKKAE